MKESYPFFVSHYYKLDDFLTENDKLTIRFYINDDFYKKQRTMEIRQFWISWSAPKGGKTK